MEKKFVLFVVFMYICVMFVDIVLLMNFMYFYFLYYILKRVYKFIIRLIIVYFLDIVFDVN